MFSILRQSARTTTNKLMGSRAVSTLVIKPGEPGRKQLALPITFLSVRGFDGPQPVETIYKDWIASFNAGGYTTFLIDIDPEIPLSTSNSSEELLAALESDLQEQLGSAAAAFPPLLISSSLSTLLAETYVSSHPLSALILHNPPSSVVLAKLHEQRDDLFRTKLDEFTYEPRFAIAVMKAAMEGEGERSRLEKEFNVEDDSQVTTLVGGLDRAGFAVAMEWMDDNGL